VEANPDKPWDYHSLSLNPNITWDIVETNQEKPWDYEYISINPNITWNIFETFTNSDNYCSSICVNKMSKHPFFQNRQLSYVLK
jgi:hypothetical protein